MNELISLSFENNNCRTVMIEEKTFWVGKDVCTILGYKDALSAIKLHCKGAAKYHPLQTTGGTQNVRVIREPDLYRLVSGSRLPAAQRFEKWIYEDVVPQLMRSGKYAVVPAVPGYTNESADLINKSSVVISRLMNETRHLRLQNSLYKKIEDLREQLVKKNTPLSKDEQEKALVMAGTLSISAIARVLNRSSDAAVRSFLRKRRGGNK